jgi:N6-adenosine-specific RNA methylase IME4
LAVMAAWGFEYKTNFCWVKDRSTYGKLGFYNYGKHELLLLGIKGSFLPNDDSLTSSVITESKSEHSRKPDLFYELIQSMYAGPYLELFARRKRDGWESFGNEV